MWACQRVLLVLSFINPLLLLVCLCVLWLYIFVLIVLSSVRPFVWYSVRPSVCLSVCMFTCTYVETILVDIENWIDLTDTLSGLSLHWTLISFGCCCFFRVAVQTTALPVCAPFHSKTVFTTAKKVHIYLWTITLYYSTSRLWQWRKVNPKPVITF